MTLRRSLSVLLTLGSLFSLAACQSAPETAPTPEKQILETPFSVGPTEPPSVKGPTTPPPNHDTPQAVTEVEKVQFTLPTTDEPDFKN